MGRPCSALAMALVLACLAACSRPPTVLVTVAAIPSESRSLAAFITRQGDDGRALSAMGELLPYDLPAPAPTSTSFVLRLEQLAVESQLTISVASFSEPGATGCLLGTGSAVHAFNPSTLDDSVTVPLERLPMGADTTCMGSERVISAGPAMLRAAGGDKLVVKGWGFRPDSTIVLNGVAVPTTYVSAGQLEATAPPSLVIGPVPLQVETGAQTSALWNGLRYIAESIEFAPIAMTPLTTNVTGVQVADLDGDRRPDLAFAPFDIFSDKVTIALQRNSLTFDVRRVTVTSGLVGMVAVDVDRDGDIDLMTSSQDDDELCILVNDGRANFQLTTYPLGFKPFRMISADMNGDGAPDAVFIDDIQESVYVRFNDGTGKFLIEEETTLDNTEPPTELTSVDYDLDGRMDIVVDSVDDMMGIYRATVLLNDGDGLSDDDSTAALLNFSDVLRPPFLNRDFDGDGKPDLLIAVDFDDMHLYPSASVGQRPDVPVPPTCEPGWLGAGDLDGDGRLDLAVACFDAVQIEFMLQDDLLSFSTPPEAKTLTVGSPVVAPLFDSQLADLDGDGKPELLTGDGSNFHVYHNISR